jgi:hypothetical protein
MKPARAARRSPSSHPARWQTRLGGAADVIGQNLRVNDRQLVIVGVTPQRFQGTVTMLTFDLWVPATLAPELLAGSRELEDRSQRGYVVSGRLAPGSTRVAAQTELDVAMRQLALDYPETNKGIQGEVLPFWRAPRGPQQFLVRALAIPSRDAAVAARGLRQHGEPDAGARERALSRGRCAPHTGRRTVARGSLLPPKTCCAARRRPRRRHRGVGHRRIARRADDRLRAGQVRDARGWCQPRVRVEPWRALRRHLWRRAGGAARTRGSTVALRSGARAARRNRCGTR